MLTANLGPTYTHGSPTVYGDATLRVDSTVTGVANALNVESHSGKAVRFIQSGGSLTIATTQVIGVQGTASYTLSGGTNFAGILNLASGSGNGSYTLDGGTLSVTTRTSIGTLGAGSFIHNSGSNTTGNEFIVGNLGGSNGSYNLRNGTVTAKTEYIGLTGTGSFEQIGGTHTALSLSFGFQNSGVKTSNGSYNLSNGNLAVSDAEIIGRDGVGSFIQSGGTHTVKTLNLADRSTGSRGSYTLGAGSLVVTGNEIIGKSGAGSFNQTGGSHTAGSLTLNQNIGSSASYNLSNGVLSVTNNESIGRNGTGTFAQSGGTHTVGNTLTLDSNGTYNLTGGTLKATSLVNNLGGNFNFTGGKLAVGNFTGNMVNSGGTMAPGASPGTTIISGNYTQSALGSFAAEIGGLIAGSQYDVLNVSGTASLGGKLQVSLYDLGGGTFNPVAGSYFDILVADELSGAFSTYEFAALSTGLAWDVSYIDGARDVVRLSVMEVTPVPEPETYAMLLAGLGLLGVIARRRNRRPT